MIIFFIAILGFFLPSTAYAHDASLTYTTVTVTGGSVNVRMTAPFKNIVELYPEKNKTIDDIKLVYFSKQFEKGFIIENDGKRCSPQLKNVKKVPDIKGIVYDFQFKCKKPINKLHFFYNLFFTISETHENITDFHIDNFKQETIFSKIQRTFDLDYKQLRTQMNYFHYFVIISTFLKLGVKHILSGYDHILFLLGLLIVTKRFRNLLKIVTAFTLAHSITLSIAVLGIFLLPARFTESMIALSIAYVAFENVKIIVGGTGLRWMPAVKREKRWMIAFLFGLIHGFGFSSVLRETGLPKDNIVYALLSFNLGVEIGQLIIITLMFPFLWYIQRQKWRTNIIITISIIIGVIGLFWFMQRLFFS